MTKLWGQETKISSKLSEENRENVEEFPNQTNVPQQRRNQTSPNKFKNYKIIVLGDSGVGKTCLSFRFCAGRFPLHSEATIGLDFREKVTCDLRNCKYKFY